MPDDNNNINKPEAAYGASPSQKKIRFFNSFDEAEEYGLKEMARHSHEERLKNLEVLRRRTFNYLLLPNGKWPPLKRIITIEKGEFK